MLLGTTPSGVKHQLRQASARRHLSQRRCAPGGGNGPRSWALNSRQQRCSADSSADPAPYRRELGRQCGPNSRKNWAKRPLQISPTVQVPFTQASYRQCIVKESHPPPGSAPDKGGAFLCGEKRKPCSWKRPPPLAHVPLARGGNGAPPFSSEPAQRDPDVPIRKTVSPITA